MPTMGVPVALLAGRRHSMLELHPEQVEVGALTAKRMKRRPGAVGQQWGGKSRTSVTTSKRELRGHAEWGECPKACKSRKASRGNRRGTRPWRGRGPSPQAGLATDGEMPIGGRRAKVEDTSKSCGPGVVEQPGVSEMHLQWD